MATEEQDMEVDRQVPTSGANPLQEGAGVRTTRFSVRPPSRFAGKGADITIWIQRIELYFKEAGLPNDKQGQELVSLLEDEPFRIVSQMDVETGIDYAAVKKCLEGQYAPLGVELDWQRKFHAAQQKQTESLIEFSARLRMLADRAYPLWQSRDRND